MQDRLAPCAKTGDTGTNAIGFAKTVGGCRTLKTGDAVATENSWGTPGTEKHVQSQMSVFALHIIRQLICVRSEL